jgi:hypothetical protein
MKHAPSLFALALAALTIAHVASAAAPPADVAACSQVPDPAERLKCYDAQLPPRSPVQPSATSPLAPPAPKSAVGGTATSPTPYAAPEAAPTAEQKFGAENLPYVAREKVDKPDQVLRSTIASNREVGQVGSKIFNISLANGQMWRQEGTTITRFFRAGDDVSIEKGLLGDYRMSTSRTGAKNWVKVVRIR